MGLAKVADLPVKAGYIDLRASVSDVGFQGRGELGWHFAPQGSLYAFGQVDAPRSGYLTYQAGVGLAYNW